MCYGEVPQTLECNDICMPSTLLGPVELPRNVPFLLIILGLGLACADTTQLNDWIQCANLAL